MRGGPTFFMGNRHLNRGERKTAHEGKTNNKVYDTFHQQEIFIKLNFQK